MRASREVYYGYILYLMLSVCFSGTIISQNFSNRGTDFWVGHMGHIDGSGSNFKLYISSTVNTSGTVSVPLQGWSIPFTITANTFAIVTVPSATGYIGCSDCTEQKGIHIVSNDNVAVYAHIYASARSDATLLLPTPVVDTLYYAMCYTQGGGEKSEFLVVATEDNTTVEITPAANTIGGNIANVPFTVTLQQGEEYQVQSLTDLTGSKILSKNINNTGAKKIVAFAGSTWNSVICNGTGDSMFEQMYPLNAWGKNFITSPLKTKNKDVFRIMAGSDDTDVSIDGVVHTLNKAEHFDTLLSTPAFISTCKPITLAQYAETEGCFGGGIGDPFMIILSPLEQTVNDVLLYSSPQQNITGQYINVVTKTTNAPTCLLDGNPITFSPVPYNPAYSWSQNTVSDGSHTLVADSGFNAIAYGFGSIESYGYLAGANIKNLDESTITVNPLPACNGAMLSFSTGPVLEPTTWKWDFGDSTTSVLQNPTHAYSDTGTFTVMLITGSYNGCDSVKDTVYSVLHINGAPHANFSFPVNCFGDSLILTDLTTNPSGGTVSSWKWTFGDGDSSMVQNTGHTYAVCDTFNIKLVTTTGNGCKDSTTKSIVIHCLPTANFSAEAVCMSSVTHFIDSSHSEITSWQWNFGDGSPPSNDSMPEHTYVGSGNYNARLIVTSAYGCIDSVTKPVLVYYNPVAEFNYTNVCLGDSVHFANSSTVHNSTSIDSYLWIFGDGSPTTTTENPSHLYSTAGAYPVTLLVRTMDSCTSFTTHTVNVFDPPQTIFSVNNSCLSDSVMFVNTSIDPSIGNIAKWQWNFGDGAPVDSTNWAPNHLYSAAGDYQVSLITYSTNLGCSDTLKDSVTIFSMPQANFSVSEVCLNVGTDFSDSSEISDGIITSWLWNLGDGQTSSLQNPVHTYDNWGVFDIGLVVTSNNGCSDSLTGSATVHPLPDAELVAQNVCFGDSVIFINQSSIPSNATNDIINTTICELGDNTTLSPFNSVAYAYDSPGSYIVELLVVSDFGCTDSTSKTVVINPNPVVLFTASDTAECEPLCVSFQNTSYVPGGVAASWLWSFGDESPGTASQDASHCYFNDTILSPVVFSPVLTVTSDSGCISSLTKNNYLTVFPNPNAAFTATPQNTTITYPVITVTNLTTGADVWTWNFGDNQTDTIEFPDIHEYADTGTYTITLIASSLYGCTDTAFQTVVLEPDFLLYIPNAFTPNGDGVNDSFIAKGVYVTTFEMLIFDRWGDIIYKTDNMNMPWDGKVNNGSEAAQMDVYIYQINVVDFKMTKHTYRGTVTLVH